jgi:hypothetical protein
MTLEQAIRESISNGWEPVDFTEMSIENRGVLFYEDFPVDRREDIEPSHVYFYDTEYPEEGYYASILMDLALLDKGFWQSLIPKEHKVVLDLPEMTQSVMGTPWHRKKQKVTYMKKTPNRWKTVWHRFIDHIAEGNDYNSFFKSLT